MSASGPASFLVLLRGGLRRFLPAFLLGLGMALATLWLAPRSSGSGEKQSLVLYCSQDQVFAEPVFAEFRRRTGIRVDPVFDSEAVKTVGLANRLIAERSSPRCDLWWGNEELRPRQLAERGVLDPVRGFRTLGHRTRVLVVAAGANQVPTSIRDLTNTAWHGRVSLAFPLFGSTATHLHVLRATLGRDAWRDWCEALAANRPFVEEGNSHVVRRVARGEAWVGLTDSDDVRAAVREGLAVKALPLDPWTLALPNTVAWVKSSVPDGPADRFVAFLASPEIQDRLVDSGAIDPVPEGQAATLPGLQPDWERVLRDQDETEIELERIFRR